MLRDDVKNMAGGGLGAQIQAEQTEPGQPNLLNRLHRRRRELEMELQRVCNSIQFVEQNAALVQVVEIVLASRDKCEPRPIGY